MISLFLITSVLLSSAHAGSDLHATTILSGETVGSIFTSDSLGACMEIPASDDQKRAIIRCGVTPIDDTFVDNLIPQKAFGLVFGNVLIVQDTPTVPRSENYAYLKFSLSSLLLPLGILASGASPVNVTLWLYVQFIVAFYNATIEVHRVSSNDWSESTLTWDNRPSFDPDTLAVQTVATNGTWARWDFRNDTNLEMKKSNEISFALTATQISWRNYVWFNSKDHFQEGNMSTKPELDFDFVEPILTVNAPYANVPVTVEGETHGTNANGTFQAVVPWGSHRISVPEVIPKGDRSRAVFTGWSDNVTDASRVITIGNDVTLNANYQIQYRLDVISPYASTNGSGWYPENTNATSSISPPVTQAEGLAGFLGVRHVFDHWTGDCVSAEPNCILVMDGPKKTTAVWKDDYAITMAGVILLLVVGIVLSFFVRRKRARQQDHYPT